MKVAYPVIAAMLFSFSFSPVDARPQDRLNQKEYRGEVFEKILGLIKEKYVDTDRIEKIIDGMRKKYASGVYDSSKTVTDWADRITADIQALSGDTHFKFRKIESSDFGEEKLSPLHHPIRLQNFRNKEHCGIFKLDWIDGNIGYLDIRRFYPLGESKAIIDGVMKILMEADVLIIDLREHQGGAGEVLTYFLSYFLPYPTQLTGYLWREGNFMQELWTDRNIDGVRLPETPLFVLISPRTFSASEIMAYDLKARKRAVLVGEPTKGGANSVDLFPVDDQFEIYISTSRAVNPVTGGNWEGKGVLPDVSVSSDSALDKAVVLAKMAGAKYRTRRDAEVKAAIDAMQQHLDNTEKFMSEKKTGQAKVELDSMVAIGARYGFANEFFNTNLAYAYNSEKKWSMEEAILIKNIDLYPRSPVSYEYLAYVYMEMGKKGPAIKQFEKVLTLDPENRNARNMLRELKHPTAGNRNSE